MQTTILAIHLLLTISMIVVILIQRSEGGGLGMGGGNMGGLMSARGTANLLTRATAVLAACFFVTSLVLAILATRDDRPSSILDTPVPIQTTPTVPTQPAPSAPPPAE